jgi:deazaflavin-dependent oxidoreductase (nitroreductase family)
MSMTSPTLARNDPGPGRPLFGVRGNPGRLAVFVFRLPLQLYRRGFGHLLGRTFLLLVHTGRRTGLPHQTVAMVLGEDRGSGELVICSAWGPDTDWVRNLRAGPAVRVQVGVDSFTPTHRFLADHEAFDVACEFRRRHRWRLRVLARILGWGDLSSDTNVTRFAESHPFVGLRPRQMAAGSVNPAGKTAIGRPAASTAARVGRRRAEGGE